MVDIVLYISASYFFWYYMGITLESLSCGLLKVVIQYFSLFVLTLDKPSVGIQCQGHENSGIEIEKSVFI